MIGVLFLLLLIVIFFVIKDDLGKYLFGLKKKDANAREGEKK